MRKLLLFFLILISLISSSAPLNGASAGKDTVCSGTISPNNINQVVISPQTFTTSGSTNFVHSDSVHYEAWFESLGQFGPSKWAWPATVGTDGQLSFTLDAATSRPAMGADRSLTGGGIISIYRTDKLSEDQKICYFPITVNQSGTYSLDICSINLTTPNPATFGQDVAFTVTGIPTTGAGFGSRAYVFVSKTSQPNFFCKQDNYVNNCTQEKPVSGAYDYNASQLTDGSLKLAAPDIGYYSVQVFARARSGLDALDFQSPLLCMKNDIQVNDANGSPPPVGTVPGGDGTFNTPNKLPCQSDTDCSSIQTAFGPIETSPQGFISWLLAFILSISGGIVVLIIIATGYRLMTSQGDPEKVKAAREQLTAAIVGLLFIIFSLVILQAITVDILHIPGFNK